MKIDREKQVFHLYGPFSSYTNNFVTEPEKKGVQGIVYKLNP